MEKDYEMWPYTPIVIFVNIHVLLFWEGSNYLYTNTIQLDHE